MHLFLYPDYEKLSREAADMVAETVRENPSALICFPSGDSPKGMLSMLVDDAKAGRIDFSRCRFVSLDEWLGMDGSDEGSCRHFVDEYFFHPLGIPQQNIHFFDGKAEDPEFECRKMTAWLNEKGPIDIAVVGLGLNGHIGLNEPGTSFDSDCHTSELEEGTKTSAQKYFSSETELKGGITLGFNQLFEAQKIILMVSGIKKAAILAKALEGSVNTGVPASIMQQIDRTYVLVDREAATHLSLG